MASQSQVIIFSGSLASQIETWTPLEIYTILKGVVPGKEIYPSNLDYVDHVQRVVLARIGVIKDDLSNLQLMDLIKDSRNFVKNIRAKWQKVHGDASFLIKYKEYLDKPIQFKIRLPKPKIKKKKEPKVNRIN